MAMTVMYNAGAQMTLGELNKNISGFSKTLRRLSSGQKFDGADVDGASFVISERMREQIRSLLQDDQNIQNGLSLVKTAERGVDQIVQNLRTMKELAIDAANDSNTDDDRRTIQKELDQLRATIDEIAIGTQFNGKILLDGRWTRNGLLSPENGSGGLNTSVSEVVAGFNAGSNAQRDSATVNGGSGAWQFQIDSGFGATKDGTFEVELNFSDMKLTGGSYPEALHNQGFTILCGACEQYINILFDANKTAAQSTYDKTAGVTADDPTDTNPLAREFVIGVKTVKNAKDLANAIFNGVSAVQDQISRSSYGTVATPNTPNDILLDANHEVRIRRDSDGKILITKNGPALQFKEGTVSNPLKDPPEPVHIEKKPTFPLWIQHGTQAGQHMNVYIEDVRSEALGINAAEVVTREKANSAIAIIEDAIEIALDEATNLGAYLQRFEYTGSNVTTTNENTQAAESTIRDADMAKEMAEYMKYNLLSQSAQAMLSQANQNASNVLGFIQ